MQKRFLTTREYGFLTRENIIWRHAWFENMFGWKLLNNFQVTQKYEF